MATVIPPVILKFCLMSEKDGYRETTYYTQYTYAMEAFNGLIHKGSVVTLYELDPVSNKYEKIMKCKE